MKKETKDDRKARLVKKGGRRMGEETCRGEERRGGERKREGRGEELSLSNCYDL